MLMPKKVKHRKQMRGRMRGVANRGSMISFGEYGLKTLEPAWITDRQIEAIWYYLSLGTSAADPSGIRAAETTLFVTDATRTYRGRSSVAGFRGIAVGFPEKLSYAFNAETGALSAIWRGNFVRVDRSGEVDSVVVMSSRGGIGESAGRRLMGSKAKPARYEGCAVTAWAMVDF